MSHLHKGRLAQVNEAVDDLKKERTPEETAKALDAAAEYSVPKEPAVTRAKPRKRAVRK